MNNRKVDAIVKRKRYYEQYYADYPDVVTLPQFRQMLGGMGEVQARRLMQENRVQHFYIRGEYLIPKKCIIDYVLSFHYAKYRAILKCSVPIPD